jgi:hypothetical protein
VELLDNFPQLSRDITSTGDLRHKPRSGNRRKNDDPIASREIARSPAIADPLVATNAPALDAVAHRAYCFGELRAGSMPFGPMVPGATTPGATSSDFVNPGPIPPGASMLLPVVPDREGLVAAGGNAGWASVAPFRPGSVVAALAPAESITAARRATDLRVCLFIIASFAFNPSITTDRAKGRRRDAHGSVTGDA